MCLDGKAGASTKQKNVDTFQSNDDIMIILGQKMPLGEGWTLTAAQDVVDAEPDWTPGRNDQLFDRVHRRGQVKGVVCHVPVMQGTLDERVLSTTIRKAISINEAMDG